MPSHIKSRFVNNTSCLPLQFLLYILIYARENLFALPISVCPYVQANLCRGQVCRARYTKKKFAQYLFLTISNPPTSNLFEKLLLLSSTQVSREGYPCPEVKMALGHQRSCEMQKQTGEKLKKASFYKNLITNFAF